MKIQMNIRAGWVINSARNEKIEMIKSIILSSPLGLPLRKIKKLAVKNYLKIQGCYTDLNYYISRLPDDSQIVQIGSNDGATGDPLHNAIKRNKKWRALFVEPVPYLFERLKTNYGDSSRFQFANVAITDGKEIPFYCIDSKAKEEIPDLPAWHDQIGSFSREHLSNSPLKNIIEPYIKEIYVSCKSFRQLLSDNNISKIDMLHIDAEGYDWKVLSQLNLNETMPRIILYEHKCITEKDKNDAKSFLLGDYTLYEIGGDTLAIRKSDNKMVQSTLWSLRAHSVPDL